jgi:hypothetical protein
MLNTIEVGSHWDKESKQNEKLVATPGIWVNGKTYWIKNGNEELVLDEGISIYFRKEDLHPQIKYFDIFVTNHDYQEKEVKLLMMHRFEKATKDHFSFVSPVEKVIYHISDSAMYLVNGELDGNSINHCTIQQQWNFYSNQYWDCHDKGHLKYQPMGKGTVVSIYLFPLTLKARSTVKSNSWVISAHTKTDLMNLNSCFLKTH